jgi:dual specificity tyrosine-phosphorylation-regulated kinase 2/3/4
MRVGDVIEKNNLNEIEKRELNNVDPEGEIYFIGENANKISHLGDKQNRYRVGNGDQISYRYEIIKKIGKGAFGDVYESLDHKRNRKIALKIIRNEKRFHIQGEIEVEILIKVSECPECVNILKCFNFREHLCISFELHLKNLYESLKDRNFKGFEEKNVKSIAICVLKGMKFLKEMRIIHADLKPENILFIDEKEENVKIIDFGSACMSGNKIHTYIQSRYYRSPEIYLGLGYGTAIDSWSFGCILYELWTGNVLFPAKNGNELLQIQLKVLGEIPVRLLSLSNKTKDYYYLGNKGYGLQNKVNLSHINKTILENTVLDEFIMSFLKWYPHKRITPEEALENDFLKE